MSKPESASFTSAPRRTWLCHISRSDIPFHGSPLAHILMLANLFDDGWQLDDGEARQRESPDSFEMPAACLRASLRPGQLVKLLFRIALEDEQGNQYEEVERMWVIVDQIATDGLYAGTLDNDPYCTSGIRSD